jgi:hypothetical protein
MTHGQIERTKKVVIPTFMILFVVGVIEAFLTSNEFALSDIALNTFLIPIIILSIVMSAYWILLTDDFWDLYEGIDIQISKILRTALKFIVWIPGMGLCFFAVIQGLLSIYNRTAGEQKLTAISGQIIDKDQYSSRYYFEINDLTVGREIEIKVDESDYNKFEKGDNYKTERKIGALGTIYEKR